MTTWRTKAAHPAALGYRPPGVARPGSTGNSR